MEASDRRRRACCRLVPASASPAVTCGCFRPGNALSSQSVVNPPLVRALQMLMVMAVLLLLIAASNVTTLVVARGVAARREVAICLALGASRTRLLAERLVDNLLVATGRRRERLLVAAWLADVLLLLLPLGSGPPSVTTTPDRRTMLFTVGWPWPRASSCS